MSYYETLGIPSRSTALQIKQAYFLKIRQYPVELHPERFQEIQLAYQTLSNEQSRSEYDIKELHGDKLSTLEELAYEAFNNGDYQLALQYYLDILDYFPTNDVALNRCGLCSFQLNEINQSIDYWQRAVELDDDNEIYHYNLGTGYEEIQDYQKAIRCFKQAILRNPLNFEVVEYLSSLYLKLDEPENAWNIVELTMKKNIVRDELKPLFIIRLIEISAILNQKFEMRIALKYAEKYVEEYPYLTEDFLISVYNHALKLMKYKRYTYALDSINFVIKHGLNDKQLLDIKQNIEQNIVIYREYDELQDDEALPKQFRLKVYTYFYSDDFEEDEFEEAVSNVNELIYDLCVSSPYEARTAISYIKRNYPTISQEIRSWIHAMEKIL